MFGSMFTIPRVTVETRNEASTGEFPATVPAVKIVATTPSVPVYAPAGVMLDGLSAIVLTGTPPTGVPSSTTRKRICNDPPRATSFGNCVDGQSVADAGTHDVCPGNWHWI